MAIKETFEKIKTFCKENTTKAVVIGGTVLIIILLIILLIVITVSSGKSVNGKSLSKKAKLEDTEIILTENQMIPDGPEADTDYVISRTVKEKWSEEEVDEWFTNPTLKDVENLGKSNDKIVQDILENAP